MRHNLKPTIYGVGVRDLPSYKDGKRIKSFVIWSNIIRRCYDDKYYLSYPQYRNTTVAKEWHVYSQFKDWFDTVTKNIQYDRYKYQVDKDLLGDGKIYSPETCVMLPKRLNVLLAGQHHHILLKEAERAFTDGLISKIIHDKIKEVAL